MKSYAPQIKKYVPNTLPLPRALVYKDKYAVPAHHIIPSPRLPKNPTNTPVYTSDDIVLLVLL